jgi:hypothetical protein
MTVTKASATTPGADQFQRGERIDPQFRGIHEARESFLSWLDALDLSTVIDIADT